MTLRVEHMFWGLDQSLVFLKTSLLFHSRLAELSEKALKKLGNRNFSLLRHSYSQRIV